MSLEDSSLLPATDNPPGQATLYTAEKTTTIPDPGGTVVTTDIEFDYSAHLDRVVTALEQLSVSMATISANISIMIQHTGQISDTLTTSDSSKLADNIQILSTKISEMQTLASSSGIHTIGPYEWLAYSSILQLYEEQGIDIASLKARVDALPKTDGY